jgi:hypothetical protein
LKLVASQTGQLEQQVRACHETEKIYSYIMKLYEAKDGRNLVEKVNETFMYVHEFNTFLRIARSVLSLDESVSVNMCLNMIRGILVSQQK